METHNARGVASTHCAAMIRSWCILYLFAWCISTQRMQSAHAFVEYIYLAMGLQSLANLDGREGGQLFLVSLANGEVRLYKDKALMSTVQV